MISISALKTILLNTEIFIENEFFEKYIELVFNNLTTFPEKNFTQKHHILPKYYYKHRNLAVDNSKSNLVNLSVADHIKAHWYLYNCSINDAEKFSNLYCLRRMLKGKYSNLSDVADINEDHCIELYKQLQKYNSDMHKGKAHITTEETKTKISLSNKGKYADYISIHKDNIEKRVPKDIVELYLKDGYVIGRSDVTKKALSNGYNYSSKGMLGKTQSEYQKTQVHIALKDKKKSLEAKQAMKEAKIGTKKYINPTTGKVQYIKIAEIPYYESLGFYKYKKLS